MGLSEIAAGIEVTERQEDRGVATLDGTETPLEERLEPHAGVLPCSPAAAATAFEAYAAGASVGAAAREAGLASVTAAKTLYLLGIDGLCPLSPTGRRLVRDWLDAECSRGDALALSGASDREFALATFIETHEPIEGLADLHERACGGTSATVDKRDALAGTMSDVTDLL